VTTIETTELYSRSRLGMTILPVGVDIRWISDQTGVGAGAIFHPRVSPAPAPQIGGCGHGFHFSSVDIRNFIF
jgi:hypothetical protein